ncbi:MAG: hypothetical protein K8R25_13745 [Methanosarcinales archaeon]|nr:hypothetical protein [Methanosarcinales archaeon]
MYDDCRAIAIVFISVRQFPLQKRETIGKGTQFICCSGAYHGDSMPARQYIRLERRKYGNRLLCYFPVPGRDIRGARNAVPIQ